MALTDRHLLAVKAEPAYGDDAFTGSTPSEWLGIIGEPSIQESVVEVGPEEKTADGLGGQILRYGEKTDVQFTTYLVGKDSAAGDPPPSVLADLFKACNLAETVNASTDVTYDLAFGRSMSLVPSMTVYEAIRDDESGDYFIRLVKGVRGTPTITFEDGQDVRVQFSGTGLYSELSAATTAINNPTGYSGGKDRFKVQGIVFDLDGTQYDITALEIVTGMEVDEDRNLTADNAVDEVGLYLPNGNKPGGSTTFKARSQEMTNILPKVQVPADNVVPKGTLTITLSHGSDTIEIVGSGCALGAYAKNLAGSNYTFDVPLTFLDGLSITFT
ncbi:hypothetical protein FIV42_00680 [Persicimonas caeni]|uniref:Phage tail protein n=1 Tax=Persicimonas caeni TaxID=2292766 RepID=A0A4Y6PM52_PERCE|nr:hypothetical protein [Persicimonas caeni]QDG49299.1 hypothetical protein FIV42_00680 [Persicimonas caeni]QED30520.1 hypothetical protein FRD00_00675 [Persicimonas caeni]